MREDWSLGDGRYLVRLVPYAFALASELAKARSEAARRIGAVVCITDREDQELKGLGDIAPWPGISESSLPELLKSLDFRPLESFLLDCLESETYTEFAQRFLQLKDLARGARFGLESACLDLLARRKGLSLSSFINGDCVPQLISHCLVGSVDAAEVACAQGFTHLKVKVGHEPVGDSLRLLRDIRSSVGTDIGLRIDANGRFKRSQARTFLQLIERHNIQPEWIEQPLAAQDLTGLAVLNRDFRCALALDESLLSVTPTELAEFQAFPYYVLKPQFLGGFGPCQEWARFAQQRGSKIVVTNALESSVGRAATIHYASALGTCVAGCGLSNGLAEDWSPVAGSWTPENNPAVVVPGTPGLGLDLTMDLIIDLMMDAFTD